MFAEERYDYAKKLKHAIQELQKVGCFTFKSHFMRFWYFLSAQNISICVPLGAETETDLHCMSHVLVTCLLGFRPGPTQTGLYSNRRCVDT